MYFSPDGNFIIELLECKKKNIFKCCKSAVFPLKAFTTVSGNYFP